MIIMVIMIIILIIIIITIDNDDNENNDNNNDNDDHDSKGCAAYADVKYEDKLMVCFCFVFPYLSLHHFSSACVSLVSIDH